ncbi:MAG: sulfur globule family protein [Bdellovibrionales bacterium]|nr:sulfur globule family protein [Bdellovibrionales bacterium]
MRNLTRSIVTALVLQLALGGLAPATARAETKATPNTAMSSRVALLTLRDLVKASPADYVDPSEMPADAVVADKVNMMEANQDLLKQVQDNSYTMEMIRGALIRRLGQEESTQILEIRNLLQKMGDRDLEKLASESFSKGRYSADLKMKYETAYLVNEKKEILFDLLRSDLADAKSDAVKRLGAMDRATLAKEISGTTTLLNVKGDGWKHALIIVLSVVAAGLISYGIVSAVKARHERKLRELDEEYKKKDADLDASDKQRTADEIKADQEATAAMIHQHEQDILNTNQSWADKTAALEKLYADRAALREAGYTWQICDTTNQPTTVSCPYDHKTYVGTQTCAKYCLKNPQGQSLPFNDLICSSAQIPWECYHANAHDTGLSAGQTDGYNDGYDTGYDAAYATAYHNAYQDYYNIAYNSGYSRGYQYGYDDGYSDGIADGKYDGYNDGYDAGHPTGYNHGADDGYSVGYSAGYAYGQQVASGG